MERLRLFFPMSRIVSHDSDCSPAIFGGFPRRKILQWYHLTFRGRTGNAMPEAEDVYGNGTGGLSSDPLHPTKSGPAPEDFPGLGRIGADGTNRQKDHPSRFHIGFQLLALHCPSSLNSKWYHCTFCRLGKSPKTAAETTE